jgi:hypothetical protein
MQIYAVETLAGLKFGDTMPSIIALNGNKGWYKLYHGDIVERDIAEWMDGVKLGEGKKIPLDEETKKLFGRVEPEGTSAKTDTKTATEGAADDGVKEVFGDDKIHDEL